MRRDSYRDRVDAGRVLAQELADLLGRDPVVLGLPRGGVPVAAEVADALAAPVDVMVVRKLGVPGHAELAFGAVASGGVRISNDDVVRAHRLQPEEMDRVAAAELSVLAEREASYRPGEPVPLDGRLVVLVDDGLATGATMRAAVAAVRRLRAGEVVVAVPVGSVPAVSDLRPVVWRLVCPLVPHSFGAVSRWYDDFRQTSDAEVRDLLRTRRG